MYVVSSFITAIAGRLTAEKQVNEVSNIFFLAKHDILIIMPIM